MKPYKFKNNNDSTLRDKSLLSMNNLSLSKMLDSNMTSPRQEDDVVSSVINEWSSINLLNNQDFKRIL